jgi:16S rRNA (adenine1518-N6/adenine1519-N6)-dimethyltransferase
MTNNSSTRLPPLRDLVRQHDLAPRKSMGQNFLFDQHWTDRIARAASPQADEVIVEIGPGPGGLTRSLFEAGAHHIVALEKDERTRALHAQLADYYHPRELNVIYQDALSANEAELVQALAPNRPVKIVGNLPYNIGTALLLKWIGGTQWPPFYRSLTLMFQKEVADRIAARPCSKAYGRLSVLCQWRCEVKPLFDIPREAFTPPPKVTSTLIQLVPRPHPLPCDPARLETLLAAAFGQRRKMLRSSLKGIGLTAEEAEIFCKKAGIEASRRAETLSVEEFVALARQEKA